MRVLVCGSRTWRNKALIAKALYNACAIGGLGEMAGTVIDVDTCTLIHGCAPGADTLSEEAWRDGLWDNGHPENCVLRFPADWKRYGKRAGMIRNKQMLDEGKPDLILAFWDGKSRGTKNMIELAEKAGIPVKIVLEELK